MKSRYWTANELAAYLGEPKSAIQKMTQLQVIEPAFRGGEISYPTSAIFRAHAYRSLQRSLGVASSVPARVVREAGPQIDAIIAREEESPSIAGVLGEALSAVVFTPEVMDEIAAGVESRGLVRSQRARIDTSIPT